MSLGGWSRQSLGSIHARAVHSRRVRTLAAHFADLIPHGHSVLDVGCGDGLIDRLLFERRPDLHIEGVDVLVRADSQIPVTWFDGRELAFPDASWDTVLLCDVLHHAEDPIRMLREVRRVARHSVVIKDHLVTGILARPTLRLMDFVGNAPHGVALPFNYFDRDQWNMAYQSADLVPIETRARLDLYPAWADPIFGRSLHFIARCELGR